MSANTKELTGYPSVDRPWEKYYLAESLTTSAPECTTYDYIYNRNKDHLDDIALNYIDKRITYRSMFDNINEVVKAFYGLGIRKGDIVTIASVSTPETIYCMYALSRLGAVANMVDPRTSVEGIHHYIEEVHSPLVLTIAVAAPKIVEACKNTSVKHIVALSPYTSIPAVKKAAVSIIGLFKQKPEALKACMSWQDFLEHGKDVTPVLPPYEKDHCCIIVHTGGTTGEPKGVMLSHDNINVSTFNCLHMTRKMKRKHTWLDIMPPFIAYGAGNGLHMPLATGMELILIPSFNPAKYADLLNKYHPNHMLGVPSHYRNLTESPKMNGKDLSYLYTAIVGGDTMKLELERETNEWLKAHGCAYTVQKGYGMSEVGAAVTYTTDIHDDCNPIGSVGIPYPNNILAAFDPETGKELPYNEQGEICMTGPHTMLGYYENPEETANVLRTHDDGRVWVHSGDLGYIDENGRVFIVGRIKRMIIRHDGFKVFPTQIEDVISDNKAVAACCIVGQSDPSHSQGKLPVAFVILNKGMNAELIREQLSEKCRKELPEYAQPVDYFFIDEMPLTPIGKIDYRTLEERAA